CGAERDVPGMAPHDFDNRDAAMALGRRADAFDTLRRDQYGRRVAGRGVVDDLIEVEDGVRWRALVSMSVTAVWFLDAHPLVRLAWVIQAQIVVDRLRGEHRRQSFGERLQSVERPVPSDRDQPFDTKPF